MNAMGSEINKHSSAKYCSPLL